MSGLKKLKSIVFQPKESLVFSESYFYSKALEGRELKHLQYMKKESITWMAVCGIPSLLFAFLTFYLFSTDSEPFFCYALVMVTCLAFLVASLGVYDWRRYSKLLVQTGGATRTAAEQKIVDDDFAKHAHAARAASDVVNQHVNEWNKYVKRIELGLAKPDPGQDEYFEVLSRAREQVVLAVARTEFILEERRSGGDARAKLPDLSEILTKLHESAAAVQAHLDAQQELEAPDHLMLARQQAELDQSVEELGDMSARRRLGMQVTG